MYQGNKIQYFLYHPYNTRKIFNIYIFKFKFVVVYKFKNNIYIIKVRCPTPLSIENGYYNDIIHYHNDLVIYNCHKGYHITENYTVACTSERGDLKVN